MVTDNNLVRLCTTGSLDALKNWMRLSLNRNLIFENYILQGVLTTRDFAARDFATCEIFRGFKSLVLTAQSLLLAIFLP